MYCSDTSPMILAIQELNYCSVGQQLTRSRPVHHQIELNTSSNFVQNMKVQCLVAMHLESAPALRHRCRLPYQTRRPAYAQQSLTIMPSMEMN